MTTVDSPTTIPTSGKLLFRDLGLRREVELAVEMSGYIEPTSIQSEIVPWMLQGRDVLAQSQTGTGKTAAFALPILSRLDEKLGGPQVLVLTPTRELATQVAKSFETYGACLPNLQVAAIFGGADYAPQLRKLKRGAQIVVGTPGRVLDHIRRGTLRLDGIRCLVLDEADEMLNLGFIEDVELVLSQTPAEKQIALFSATVPEPIRKIADQYLRDPASVRIGRKALTAESIEQRCVFVEERDKLELLSRLLELEPTDGVVVFTKTKDATLRVADKLIARGLRAAALNGDLPQTRRQHTVDQLKSGQLDILVATDVAARGMDVPRISHVFNFDLPHDGEAYVHRIGRTGRAGRHGVAVIFLTPRQRSKLRLIEKVTRQKIHLVEPPTVEEINAARISRFKQQVEQAAQRTDIALYRKVIEDYQQQSGQPLELIAAALAHLAQAGSPLLVKDELPSATEASRAPRGGTRSHGEDTGYGRRSRKTPRQPPAGMQRFWLGVGQKDGVKPGNIVGAVASEAGIRGSDIGPIYINDAYSTIDLPADLSAEALRTLQRTWVSGKQLRIRPYLHSRHIHSADADAPRHRKRKPAPNARAARQAIPKELVGKRGRKGKRHKGPRS
jgi:ATP-dependent RNA helicase DeaD